MGARILIIEDNTANLELMSYLLNSFGHTSHEAWDGGAGLDSPALLTRHIEHFAKSGSLEVILRPIEPRALLAEVAGCLQN